MSCAALGINPETVQRKATDDIAAQAPLINVIRNSSTFLQSFQDCLCSPNICRLLAENAVRADKMYRQPEQTISLFSTILRLTSSMIDEARPEWCAYDQKPLNGVIDVEGPYEFYRLWCALQFVLCMPQGEDELQHLEMYGDGINWAGCTIMYLLGQRNRFEAFSFTNHTLDIEDAAKERTSEPSLVQFLKNAVYDRELNEQIFSTLETYLVIPSYNADLALGVPSELKLNYFMQIKDGSSGSDVAPTPVQRAPAPVSRGGPPPLAPVQAPAPPPAPKAPAPAAPELPEEEEEEVEEEEEEEEDAPPALPTRGVEEEEEEEEPPEPDEEEEEDEPPPLPVSRNNGGYEDDAEEEEEDEEAPPPPDDEEYEEEEEDDDAPPPLPTR